MNKEIKKKWVEALRSGKYKQGKLVLKIHDSFCAAGVLCDLYIRETGQEWEEHNQNIYRIHGQADYIPEEVQEWADLSLYNPMFYYNNEFISLTALNYDTNFLEVADVIEEHL